MVIDLFNNNFIDLLITIYLDLPLFIAFQISFIPLSKLHANNNTVRVKFDNFVGVTHLTFGYTHVNQFMCLASVQAEQYFETFL